MQKILFILNAPPYGSERTLTALRLATTLAADAAAPELSIFLVSDAVSTALAGQQTVERPAAWPDVGRTGTTGRGRVCLPHLSGRAWH
ncbi:DsrE family protein [Paludibacterium denitrificans]|uniref:DsrE family protein n=1 Tax=Paludibacterium denitrificans TaxID=2675226 RepID=UPI00247807D0|nr:DsrE family protein [Paludibacterium denitrificans]